eukprot:Mycagemm_TRINITY_DN10180_c0_g2::TRINITY_DN10180_c0_g2_i1::g.5080::m.5080 type:complete len:132 gc:universal TRINITY_DN10180_c0_g2_i1:641-246(-)
MSDSSIVFVLCGSSTFTPCLPATGVVLGTFSRKVLVAPLPCCTPSLERFRGDATLLSPMGMSCCDVLGLEVGDFPLACATVDAGEGAGEADAGCASAGATPAAAGLAGAPAAGLAAATAAGGVNTVFQLRC